MNDKHTTEILKEKGWNLDQALAKFTNQSHDALRRSRKTPTVWQEMVRGRLTDCNCVLANGHRCSATM